MRKTCDSSKAEAIASLSARALWMSWPKGFSKTTRVQKPPALFAPRGRDEARAAQPLDDGAELARGHGEVKEPAAHAPALGVGLLEEGAELLEGRRIARRAPHVADAALEIGPERLVDGLAPENAETASFISARNAASLFSRRATPTTSEPAGQRAAAGEVVERRHQLAAGEVPRGAEDHDSASVAAAVLDEPPTERVVFRLRRRHSDLTLLEGGASRRNVRWKRRATGQTGTWH